MVLQGAKNSTRLAEEKNMAGKEDRPKALRLECSTPECFGWIWVAKFKEKNRRGVSVLHQIVALQVWGTSF